MGIQIVRLGLLLQTMNIVRMQFALVLKLCDRQSNAECRANTDSAFELNLSAMTIDDASDDRQALAPL